MRKKFSKLFRIAFGLLITSIGVVLTINSGLGVGPWEVLSMGISNIVNVSIGKVTIGISFTLLIVNLFLDQRVGLGTILDTVLTGLYIDLWLSLEIIPVAEKYSFKLLYVFLSMIFMGVGMYFYMSAEMGSGPRDSLVLGLSNKTGVSFGFVRTIVEVLVVILGYMLGGIAGVGTLILSIFTGPIVEIVFKILNFNVGELEHDSLLDEIKYIRFYMKEYI